MKTNLTARNLELTDRLRSEIERKLPRLDRMLHRDGGSEVELIANASHSSEYRPRGRGHAPSATAQVLRSSAAGATPIAALDIVIDKSSARWSAPRSGRAASGAPSEEVGRSVRGPGGRHRRSGSSRTRSRRLATVVKLKRFDMQPMFEEDASAQMDELGHAFFVFLNAETDGSPCSIGDGTDFGMTTGGLSPLRVRDTALSPANIPEPGGMSAGSSSITTTIPMNDSENVAKGRCQQVVAAVLPPRGRRPPDPWTESSASPAASSGWGVRPRPERCVVAHGGHRSTAAASPASASDPALGGPEGGDPPWCPGAWPQGASRRSRQIGAGAIQIFTNNPTAGVVGSPIRGPDVASFAAYCAAGGPRGPDLDPRVVPHQCGGRGRAVLSPSPVPA